MASYSPQALTPQKRHIEKSIEKADSVLRSAVLTINNRTFYGSTKRTRLFSNPRSSLDNSPSRDFFEPKKRDVYEFDENGEVLEESCFPRTLKSHEIGFPNPPGSNICWMNATLQLLLGMRTLIDELENPKSGSSISRNHYSPILQTFLDVVRQYKKGRLLPVHKDVSNLRSALATLDASFVCESQQDAPEFLIRLLDHFREDFYEICNAEKRNANGDQMALKELQFSNNNLPLTPLSPVRKVKVNPICDNLQFSMKEIYCCVSCGMQSEKSQEHLALYVDIPSERESTSSVTSALAQYMKTHMRDLRCEKCSGEQCRVNTVFSQIPRMLLIQVKRYTCLEHLTQKINNSIAIPLELNISDFVDEKVVMPKAWQVPSSEKRSFNKKEKIVTDGENDENIPYEGKSGEDKETEEGKAEQKYCFRLTGILSHHGDNPNTGHYVADVYHHIPRRWYHYDDENVEMVGENEICDETREQSGYLFVYMYRFAALARKYQLKNSSNAIRIEM